MNTGSPTPLWREVVGETEPWRRGRLFLIIAAIPSFTTQIATLTLDILAGYVEQALAVAISAALFWLQYYFIWIGVHWVRWLNGALTMLWGFALIIWGARDGSGLGIVVGAYCLMVGAYLGRSDLVGL
ncbi:MAG TPA: hypothetical protein VGQ82_12205 [Chthoniobacterales bacterium]|nr:hypothetical protein [Chthoniobacterales bacterium]